PCPDCMSGYSRLAPTPSPGVGRSMKSMNSDLKGPRRGGGHDVATIPRWAGRPVVAGGAVVRGRSGADCAAPGRGAGRAERKVPDYGDAPVGRPGTCARPGSQSRLDGDRP